MCMMLKIKARARVKVAIPTGSSGCAEKARINAPVAEAATNNMPRNNEAAAEEHRREKPVLPFAEAIAEHADEPQKGDAGERDQVQGKETRRFPSSARPPPQADQREPTGAPAKD